MGMTKYIEITESLRREILSGRLGSKAAFPSGSSLSERFGVSRPTINRAMQDLRREGLVNTHSGRVPRLTRFAQHATGTLGMIHPGIQYGDVLSKICESLVRQGDRLGWEIVQTELSETSSSRRFAELLRVIRQFADERVAGLFLQPFDYMSNEESAARRFWSELSTCGMPVVLLDYTPLHGKGAVYDLVSMDNVRAGHDVGMSLLKRGMRRISFLLRPGSAPSVVNRMRGVASAVAESGGRWSEQRNVLACEPDDRRSVSLFAAANRPDAIICGNDIIAVRLHHTLAALGLSETIRLGGFDNQPEAAELGVTSVVQPCEDLATMALHTLLARMHNPRLPVHTILLPYREVVR